MASWDWFSSDVIKQDETLNAFFVDLTTEYFNYIALEKEKYLNSVSERKNKIEMLYESLRKLVFDVSVSCNCGVLLDYYVSNKDPSFFDKYLLNNMMEKENFFVCSNHRRIMFENEDIEFLKQVVEENKNSNVEIELVSPAEKKYYQFIDEEKYKSRQLRKHKLKELSNGVLKSVLFFNYNKFHDKQCKEHLKANKLEVELSEQWELLAKAAFFQELDYQKAKNVLELYNDLKKTPEMIKNLKEEIAILDKEYTSFDNGSLGAILDKKIENNYLFQNKLEEVELIIFKMSLLRKIDETRFDFIYKKQADDKNETISDKVIEMFFELRKEKFNELQSIYLNNLNYLSFDSIGKRKTL